MHMADFDTDFDSSQTSRPRISLLWSGAISPYVLVEMGRAQSEVWVTENGLGDCSVQAKQWMFCANYVVLCCIYVVNLQPSRTVR